MVKDTPQPSDQEVDDEAEGLFRDLDEEESPSVGVGSVWSPSALTDPNAHGGRRVEEVSRVERWCEVDMCKVFSPPRAGLEATKFGLKAGHAMDLTTGWDFNLASHRAKAEE